MKKIVFIIILILIPLFANAIWIETDEGLGKYKYIELDATTYIHYGTDWSSWNRSGVFVTTNNWTNQAYYAGSYAHDSGSNKHLSTGDLNSGWHANWIPGAYLTLSIAIDDNDNDPWTTSQNYNNFAQLVNITTSTSGLATTIVDNPIGSQNLVMNFKIDATVDETLNRFWVKNNGTAQETSDIPNAGLELYYENVTGSESFGGDESSATLYGNYNSNPTDNEYWGHDALGISIPIGGLRCYLVIVDLTSEYNPAHTTNFAIINNGISLNYGLMRIDETISGGDPATLPVSLSTFTAQYLAGKPLLYWTTQSETDNMGWFVYRNQVEDFTSATKVSGMIEGHGTTTQAQSYIYEDVIADPQVDDVYYYWLESIDYSGTIHHFDKVAMITIPDINNPNPNVTPPQVYDLLASPNPFNENTNIEFMLTQTAMVDVAIYDVKGALVKSFNSLHITADDLVSLQWDGKDENSKSLSNGIYLYSLKVNGQDYATKQVILMK